MRKTSIKIIVKCRVRQIISSKELMVFVNLYSLEKNENDSTEVTHFNETLMSSFYLDFIQFTFRLIEDLGKSIEAFPLMFYLAWRNWSGNVTKFISIFPFFCDERMRHASAWPILTKQWREYHQNEIDHLKKRMGNDTLKQLLLLSAIRDDQSRGKDILQDTENLIKTIPKLKHNLFI